MKSSSRLITLLLVALVAMIIIAIPVFQSADRTFLQGKATTSTTRTSTPSPIVNTMSEPASITVHGQQWGESTCYIGATEGSSRFNISDLQDLGINSYHIYGGMSRWEPQDDSSVYGYPTIAQIKANPNVINWAAWDTIMTNPPSGSDYWWQPAPRWQGNARTLFSELQAANIRIILTLRNRDDHGNPSWAPDPPRTTADWNEWWEHVFATVYWLDVLNNYNVTDFEILNEPNIPNQGWSPEATQADYYTFAQYTYDAVSYVFNTYLPGQTFHVHAPDTSGNSWTTGVLRTIPQYFDSMDVHIYGNFKSKVEQVHASMDQAGYAQRPLWITEWGSYTNQYVSEPYGINLINDLISGSSPGNDYVYGSNIFALYDYSKNALGLIDFRGYRRIDYYAMRMGIRALQGCRPTFQSVASNKNLLAITTTDDNGNVYLLVTNQSSNRAYAIHADLSALRNQASGVMWLFDSNHLDTIVGKPSLKNGNVTITIPASSAVLLKF